MSNNSLVIALSLSLLALGHTSKSARAEKLEDPKLHALDFKSDVATCPEADYLKDRVSASLGYKPWSDWQKHVIRVRIQLEDEDIVATIEFPDGSAKIVRATDCLRLTDSIVAALTLSLDLGRAPPREPVYEAPHQGRQDEWESVSLEASSKEPGLEVKVVESEATAVAYGGGKTASGYAMHYKVKCQTPCTFNLPPGYTKLAGGLAVKGITLKANHHYKLKIKPGSRGKVIGGFCLILMIGAPTLLGGTVATLAGEEKVTPLLVLGSGALITYGGWKLMQAGKANIQYSEMPRAKGEMTFNYSGRF